MSVLNEVQLQDAISTLLLYFLAEGKEVELSNLEQTLQIALDIVERREEWLEAAGWRHQQYVEGQTEDLPTIEYAALGASALQRIDADPKTITEWATILGGAVCRLLSKLRQDYSRNDWMNLVEWFIYLNSSQTGQPVRFQDHNYGKDSREFFARGFQGELEIID